jgi:membrane fusion protein (multidrug efflux system)
MRHFPLIAAAALASLCASCGGGEAKGKGERQAPVVKVEQASAVSFTNSIDAVGTAVANEQVVVTAPVTERIVRLSFDDGDFVRQGQVLAVLQQGQETAQLREVQARQREAQQQLQRIESLKNRGFATRSSYDAQVAAAAAAGAQAQQVQAQIGERVIRAPFSGWVSLRTVSVGAVVSQGTEIATISDISTIKLDFTVPETLLSALSPGLAIEALSAAYEGRVFRGQITTIDPVIDPVSRAVRVRALLRNPDLALRPGMAMNVRISSSARTSLSVPELAVVGEGDARYVFVLGEGNRVRRTPVRTGVRQGGRVEILEGLPQGARVVTEGVVKVTDGMTVRLPGQNPPARPAAKGG